VYEIQEQQKWGDVARVQGDIMFFNKTALPTFKRCILKLNSYTLKSLVKLMNLTDYNGT